MNNDVSSFDSFWQKIVLKALSLCQQELDNEFAKQANFTVEDLEIYKNKLEKIYKRKREWLKSEYLPNEENPILDFHKLSSIMCRSIIGIKPFRYDIDEAEKIFAKISKDKQKSQIEKVNWQINNVYVNYKLAFLVAEGIIFIDLLFWAQKKINEIEDNYESDAIEANTDNVKNKLQVYRKFINLLNSQQRLYSYKASNTHDNFIISAIIALMKNDYLKRDFDYLQFSLSMFQWQEYTKKQNLYDILNNNSFNLTLADLV